MDSTKAWLAKREEELRLAWKAKRRWDTDGPSCLRDLDRQVIFLLLLCGIGSSLMARGRAVDLKLTVKLAPHRRKEGIYRKLKFCLIFKFPCPCPCLGNWQPVAGGLGDSIPCTMQNVDDRSLYSLPPRLPNIFPIKVGHPFLHDMNSFVYVIDFSRELVAATA